MSLSATVQEAVETAFAAAGDIVQSITWRQQTFGDYDPAAGQRAVTASNLTVRAIEGEWEAGEAEKAGLSAKAIKLFIPAQDFTAGDPVFDDKFVRDGQVFTCKRAKYEGGKFLWEVWADV